MCHRYWKHIVPPNFSEAEKWLQWARQANYPDAERAISEMRYFQKRLENAQNGDWQAQLAIAQKYERSKSWAEVARWYKIAEAQKPIDKLSLRRLAALPV
jgi:hypothetical protein